MEKSEIIRVIYSAIVEVSPYAAESLSKIKGGDENIFLVDLGINSIDYAQIANMVMNDLNIDRSLDVFARTNSIPEIVDIFFELMPAAA